MEDVTIMEYQFHVLGMAGFILHYSQIFLHLQGFIIDVVQMKAGSMSIHFKPVPVATIWKDTANSATSLILEAPQMLKL
jgi:hypothetical protein